MGNRLKRLGGSRARLTRLGSRHHAQKEGRLDGLAGVPGADWNDLPAPSERGFDALGDMAQAQIGMEFYDDINRPESDWQALHRDLLRWKRRARRATEDAAKARRALDKLLRRFEEDEPR